MRKQLLMLAAWLALFTSIFSSRPNHADEVSAEMGLETTASAASAEPTTSKDRPLNVSAEASTHRARRSRFRLAKNMTAPATKVAKQLAIKNLYCRFGPHFAPNSWLVYDAGRNIVFTRTGSPLQTQAFENIQVVAGLDPYGDLGVSLVAFNDAPLVAVRLNQDTGNPIVDHIRKFFDCLFGEEDPATWEKAPGGPSGVLDDGECELGQPSGWHYNEFVGW